MIPFMVYTNILYNMQSVAYKTALHISIKLSESEANTSDTYIYSIADIKKVTLSFCLTLLIIIGFISVAFACSGYEYDICTLHSVHSSQ